MNGYIAVLDSGVGGVSVLAAAKKLLPQENFIYFADLANAPYGDKSKEQVAEIVWNQVAYLRNWPLKALVLACNTATSAAASLLRRHLDLPVLGMEPALKPAVACQKPGAVVVMGTSLTLREEKFRLLLAQNGHTRKVIPLACPGLMEMVERGRFDGETDEYLDRLLAPYQRTSAALVLGCTHYVFLRPRLAKRYPHLTLYDGNQGVCRHLAEVLAREDLRGGEGRMLWLSSAPQQDGRAEEKCRRFYQWGLDLC